MKASPSDKPETLFTMAPMMRAALGLGAGILLGSWFPVPYLLPSILWKGIAVGLVLLFFSSRRLEGGALFTHALWVTLILAGWQLTLLRAPSDPFPDQPEEVVAIVRLSDTPHPARSSIKVPAEVLSLHDSTGWHPVKGSIMLFIRQDTMHTPLLRYGHTLVARVRPQIPPGSDQSHDFDYRSYLYNKGILWQCFLDSGQWVLHPSPKRGNGLVSFAKDLQLRMVQRLRGTSLTPSQQGMAEALLLGWREDLDDATRQQFNDAGVAHLLCVSGLHVGIVAAFVGVLLFPLGQRRWARVTRGFFQLGAIWLFVLLTGMAPPTLRAGVMFTLLVIGGNRSGVSHSFNNLATSAVLLFCVRPTVLFEVGFQLSYAAVLGILAWHRPMERLLPIPKENPLWWLPRKAWSLLCLTTSAQLATFPLTLHYFHQFSPWFPIANLLVVPAAGVMLVTVLLVTLTGGAFVTRLLDIELTYADALTRWVDSLPHAVIGDLYCDLPMMSLLLLSLFFFSLWWLRHRRWALPLMLLCWVVAAALLRWS